MDTMMITKSSFRRPENHGIEYTLERNVLPLQLSPSIVQTEPVEQNPALECFGKPKTFITDLGIKSSRYTCIADSVTYISLGYL